MERKLPLTACARPLCRTCLDTKTGGNEYEDSPGHNVTPPIGGSALRPNHIISVSDAPAPRSLWAVLLAGGDGLRLRGLTETIVGDQRPKQFCAILGPRSLLSDTRCRLSPRFSLDRQAFVLLSAHESYYRNELADAKESLLIAQPANRGTAVGIIAALIQIMQIDPDAITALFPCDHYYSNEEAFRSVVQSAIKGAEQFPEFVIVVGAAADYAETDYGWIEPAELISQSADTPLYRVNRFWEKPASPQARACLKRGCLWNTFVTVGRAATLLDLVCSEAPNTVLSITRALADGDLTPTYDQLPIVDFSRDMLANQANRLLVLPDLCSGWADLGSPDRVLGLLANSSNQPAWFRRTQGARGEAMR